MKKSHSGGVCLCGVCLCGVGVFVQSYVNETVTDNWGVNTIIGV